MVGVPKHKISTIGKQIIIEKKKQRLYTKGIESEEISVGSWWYDITKEKGCIDPHYSHVAPDVERENSSPSNEYEIENKEWIDAINRYIELFFL